MGKKLLCIFCLLVSLCGCTKYLDASEFLSYYESHCKSELGRGNMTFFAMPLSPDYEKAKWGAPLDSGKRVLFWSTPRSDISFEDAFLYAKQDTSAVVISRKSEAFELGTADLFVLSFAEKYVDATLYVRKVSRGVGDVEMNLKNCENIRLREK